MCPQEKKHNIVPQAGGVGHFQGLRKAFANAAVALWALSYSHSGSRPQEIHGFSPWTSYWLSAQPWSSQGSDLF